MRNAKKDIKKIKIKKKNKEKNIIKKNKEKCKKSIKEWRENNPDKVFNYANKRRSIEENQGDGISKDQWLEMMKFFDWRCAYSGIMLNKDNRSIDHVVALNNGGLNEIWNCVPMYMPYNTSKHTRDMLEWYTQQEYFSEERLNKIYEWIEYAKNKWEINN